MRCTKWLHKERDFIKNNEILKLSCKMQDWLHLKIYNIEKIYCITYFNAANSFFTQIFFRRLIFARFCYLFYIAIALLIKRQKIGIVKIGMWAFVIDDYNKSTSTHKLYLQSLSINFVCNTVYLNVIICSNVLQGEIHFWITSIILRKIIISQLQTKQFFKVHLLLIRCKCKTIVLCYFTT